MAVIYLLHWISGDPWFLSRSLDLTPHLPPSLQASLSHCLSQSPPRPCWGPSLAPFPGSVPSSAPPKTHVSSSPPGPKDPVLAWWVSAPSLPQQTIPAPAPARAKTSQSLGVVFFLFFLPNRAPSAHPRGDTGRWGPLFRPEASLHLRYGSHGFKAALHTRLMYSVVQTSFVTVQNLINWYACSFTNYLVQPCN